MSRRVLVLRSIERQGPGLIRNVLEHNDIPADVVDLSPSLPDPTDYGAVVILGGPASANDETPEMAAMLELTRSAVDAKVPFLGICLGHQVLSRAIGGEVVPALVSEVGFFDDRNKPYTVSLTEAGREDPLFRGVDDSFHVFQLHAESIDATETDAVVLATSDTDDFSAVRVGHNAYGLQMHVEITSKMLGSWARSETNLDRFEPEELQAQLEAFEDDYARVGKRVLTNFCQIADLTHR